MSCSSIKNLKDLVKGSRDTYWWKSVFGSFATLQIIKLDSTNA